jgi:hypothetical protein
LLQCLQNFSYFTLERIVPLIHSPSKKAFEKNVRTEIVKGNKPQKQAVAIAYSVKRKAPKKASGGSMSPHSFDSDVDYYSATNGPHAAMEAAEDVEPHSYKAKTYKKAERQLKSERELKKRGSTEEAKKLQGRRVRRANDEYYQSAARAYEHHDDEKGVNEMRKAWERTVNKPVGEREKYRHAPFKKGGKVCW